MTSAQFRERVARLEIRAAEAPRTYRWSVVAMAIMGYGYVLGLLVLSLTGVGYLILAILHGHANAGTFKLLLIVGVFALMAIRALWVRIPSPEGRRITRQDSPELFTLIEDLRSRLDAPHFHRIVLNEELNAAIVQTPRLGVLGWYQNTLLIGVPLLQALSVEEFTAVLAHEMGHVSGNHGKLSSWIYRVRLTWGRLRAQIEATHHWLARLLVGRFLSWYEPAFAARSFVLARAHEYEADLIAAQASGADAAGRALMKLAVLSRQLSEQFWPRVYDTVGSSAEPPLSPLRQLLPGLQVIPEDAGMQRWLQEAWSRPTDYGDTHPSLADRLRALGWDDAEITLSALIPTDDPSPSSAADRFLGTALESHIEGLDQAWRASLLPKWRAEYEARSGLHQRLAELQARSERSIEQDWERVQLIARIEGNEPAVAAAQALLLRQDHGGALFLVGQSRLVAGDPSGVELLERAGKVDAALALAVSETLFQFFWNRGERERAERHRARLDDGAELRSRADEERRSLDKSPVLVSPDIPADQLAKFTEALQSVEGLDEVYLARRVVELLPEQPCYLVGIKPKTRWCRFETAQRHRRMLQQVVESAASWTRETYYVVLVDNHKKLQRRFREVPGAALLKGAGAGSPEPIDRQVELRLLRAGKGNLAANVWRLTKRVAVVGFVILIGVAALGTAINSRLLNRTIPLNTFTVRGAAREVAATDGRVRLVVFYGNYASPQTVDQLSGMALHYGRRKLAYLPFALSDVRETTQEYLLHNLSTAIPPNWITPYESGELTAAMSLVGVPVPSEFATPLVTVLDPAGHAVGQWSPPDMDLLEVQATIERTMVDWGSVLR